MNTAFTGFKSQLACKRSLAAFHSVSPKIRNAEYRNGVTEVYATYPDGSRGYEHTIDGAAWIPRERSIFD